MDQLHLPPDVYRELRDRSNAGVSVWLGVLADLGRWGRKQLSATKEANLSRAHEQDR